MVVMTAEYSTLAAWVSSPFVANAEGHRARIFAFNIWRLPAKARAVESGAMWNLVKRGKRGESRAIS
jgi:hypothetical protein